MPKAMRQMPERSGRVGVAHGEAVGDPISDEARGPPREHRGAAKSVVASARARKAMDDLKARIRQHTRRSGGRSLEQVVEKLRPYLLGWGAYFGVAQTLKVWRELDKWMRHRLRAVQLRHWKRGAKIYRELKARGVTHDVAKQVAANGRRWWRNSAELLNSVQTIAWFDQLGLPSLS
ncbi:group II intron maturase-specific domain-containing protein [Hydrogenophaga sp. BPS33]|uniref:group II intron maturase-specific domain-containing protein n=1 Tax=Hydrogenophaga sp. BPS33 TaxID=2651974 RepID=UPI00131F5BC2|nr:hypothetical protein F9K07_25610 [Hydrogenophaga sp. BPS33]